MYLDPEKLWLVIAQALAGIGLIGGAVVAAGNIATKGALLSKWTSTRRQKREALERLANREFADPEKIRDLAVTVGDIAARMEVLEEKTTEHEALLRETLKETELFHFALLGLLDHAIANGANGTAHDARERLQTYLNRRAHKA